MVSYDFEHRLKAVDAQLFPDYIEHIVLDPNLKAKQWYMWKIVSNTSKLLTLEDADIDAMRDVFNKYMLEIFTRMHRNVPVVI